MNILYLEDKLFVISQNQGISAYDFNFDLHFACSHPSRIEGEKACVLRIGPVADYRREFNEKLAMGLRLVNSPDEHNIASELEYWYPVISHLTPRTIVFDTLPPVEEIESCFQWPIFMKGSRQTSKHNPDLSVIQNREHYFHATKKYQQDPILHWQKPVIREFISLMPAKRESTWKNFSVS